MGENWWKVCKWFLIGFYASTGFDYIKGYIGFGLKTGFQFSFAPPENI
jgi:hypothetical protein